MTNKRYIITTRSIGFYFTSLLVYDDKELLENVFKAKVRTHIELIAKAGKKPMVAITDKCTITVWPEGEFDDRRRVDLKIVEYDPLAKSAMEYWD